MATARKILGQSAPLATTDTPLYTVAALTSATCSSIIICNRGSADTTFRIRVAVAGAGVANEQYIYFDLPIAAYDTFTATLGFTLATTDVMSVYAGNANLSFNLFGIETT